MKILHKNISVEFSSGRIVEFSGEEWTELQQHFNPLVKTDHPLQGYQRGLEEAWKKNTSVGSPDHYYPSTIRYY